MGNEQSNPSNKNIPIQPKSILKPNVINVKSTQSTNNIHISKNDFINNISNDINPNKLQINTGINNYYNFNAADTIKTNNIPKLYESSKDDSRYNLDLEEAYSKQLMARNISMNNTSGPRLCHEVPSALPPVNVYNKNPSELGMGFQPGQLYVPTQLDQDSHVEIDRDNYDIPQNINSLPTYNARSEEYSYNVTSQYETPPNIGSYPYPNDDTVSITSNRDVKQIHIAQPDKSNRRYARKNNKDTYSEYINSMKEPEPVPFEQESMVSIPLNKLSFTKDEIMIMRSENIKAIDIDPFNLLEKNINISLQKLYECYKKLRFLNHPDKPNGNNENFIKIVKSMKLIEQIESKKATDKQFDSLKNEYNKDKSKYEADYDYTYNQFQGVKKEDFNKQFNKMFDENRYTGDYEDGYSHIMTKDKAVNEEINVVNRLGTYDKSAFNNEFSKQKKVISNQVMVYKVPEPINNSFANAQSLVGKTNNYTNAGQYTDYMEAYNEGTVLIDADKVNFVEEKDIKKALNNYKTASLALTEEQRIAIEEYNNKLDANKYKEIDYYSESNQNINKWYNSVKTLNYNPRPEPTRK